VSAIAFSLTDQPFAALAALRMPANRAGMQFIDKPLPNRQARKVP
jgi:hypothetical protein